MAVICHPSNLNLASKRSWVRRGNQVPVHYHRCQSLISLTLEKHCHECWGTNGAPKTTSPTHSTDFTHGCPDYILLPANFPLQTWKNTLSYINPLWGGMDTRADEWTSRSYQDMSWCQPQRIQCARMQPWRERLCLLATRNFSCRAAGHFSIHLRNWFELAACWGEISALTRYDHKVFPLWFMGRKYRNNTQ